MSDVRPMFVPPPPPPPLGLPRARIMGLLVCSDLAFIRARFAGGLLSGTAGAAIAIVAPLELVSQREHEGVVGFGHLLGAACAKVRRFALLGNAMGMWIRAIASWSYSAILC